MGGLGRWVGGVDETRFGGGHGKEERSRKEGGRRTTKGGEEEEEEACILGRVGIRVSWVGGLGWVGGWVGGRERPRTYP